MQIYKNMYLKRELSIYTDYYYYNQVILGYYFVHPYRINIVCNIYCIISFSFDR